MVAIDKSSGQEVWREHLCGSGTTSVCLEDDSLFASTRGRLYRLDAKTGSILWVNNLRGLGYGVCVIGTQNQSAAATLHIMVQQTIALAAASSAAAAGAAASS